MIANDDKRKVMAGLDKVTLAADFDFAMEMIDLLLGDYIGGGESRDVYDAAIYDNCVAKIEITKPCINNIKEYLVWSFFANTVYAEWFAPCIELTCNGRILIQKKVEPITDANKKLIPEYIPDIITDVKFENCGFLDGHFVFFDYSGVLSACVENAFKEGKMQKFESHIQRQVIYNEGEQIQLQL